MIANKPNTPPFSKLLIANRGEIACRVIRSAKQMGIKTVAVYSHADREALHVRMADEAVFIGESKATLSYLSVEKVIAAASETNSQAIHPGYGFLSENPRLVKQCNEHGIVLVGPSVDAIEKMGIKDTAKAIATQCGIAVLPGYPGDNQDAEALLKQARKIGFPVMIKAVAGGGGKGLKIVKDEDSFFFELQSAKREASASFGNDKMMLEKYLANPRHIEIQIFADVHGNVVSLFERDCSIQRRHQKILEEAPAPNFSSQLRQEMGQAACSLASFIAYHGAGTVEFLLDQQGSYYFLEMNTRLQVEHGITEAVTGLDLVEWQILVASGAELPLKQEQIRLHGHAIEARLCAESVEADFLPSTGVIEYMSLPSSDKGFRFDMGYETGDCVSAYYDSLIGKVIVVGNTREEACASMQQALGECLIAGVDNNVNYLQQLVSSARYQDAQIDTGFIAEFEPVSKKSASEDSCWVAAAAIESFRNHHCNQNNGWRLNAKNQLRIGLRWKDSIQQVYLTETSCHDCCVSWEASLGKETYAVTIDVVDATRAIVLRVGKIPGEEQESRQFVAPDWESIDTASPVARILFFEGNTPFLFEMTQRISDCNSTLIEASGSALSPFHAPMNGTVSAILVTPGDEFEANCVLMVVEAMKMEFPILSQAQGTVKEFFFDVGDSVEQGQILLDLEEE